MKYYAILDTNVLVSAMLKTGSIPGLVALEAMSGDIIPVLNDEIFAEYEEVLRRPKFRFEERGVRIFLDELKRRAVYVEAGTVDEVIPDEKDVVFYAVLMEKKERRRGIPGDRESEAFSGKNLYRDTKRNAGHCTREQRLKVKQLGEIRLFFMPCIVEKAFMKVWIFMDTARIRKPRR